MQEKIGKKGGEAEVRKKYRRGIEDWGAKTCGPASTSVLPRGDRGVPSESGVGHSERPLVNAGGLVVTQGGKKRLGFLFLISRRERRGRSGAPESNMSKVFLQF